MILTEYQTKAVEKLIRETKRLFSSSGQKTIVFQSPTGSGKTVMMAAYLEQLAHEYTGRPMSFLWISTNELHKQSKEKIEEYLPDSRYIFSFLDELSSGSIDENQIAFANWASLTRKNRVGEWANIAMRDGDIYKSLRMRMEEAKKAGREVILIVDESHETFWSDQTQEFIDEIIKPRLIIEVSATPKIGVSQQEYEAGKKAHIFVPIEDVIKSGIIKVETVINAEIGSHKNIERSTSDALIAAALAKRADLKKRYEKQGADINPLVLIQLPSEGESVNALDMSTKEKVIRILRREHSITFENGRLAIWLTGEQKQNLDGITEPNSEVDVLIFKTAIAKGWDCPRADILVMLREMRSVIFKIQTVGRIMRMPELKHYLDLELNRAFVYSNVPEIDIDRDDASQKYFAINVARRKDEYEKIRLPSMYVSRSDYGDLTYKFREFFAERANERFDIKTSDSPDVAYKKVDEYLELCIDELNTPVIADAVIPNIDEAKEIKGEIVEFRVPADEIKYKYTQFAKIMSFPFAPIRSHTKIQEAFYDWFEEVLGFGKKSRLEIQRIVVCSEKNQKIFSAIIEAAKDDFHAYKKDRLKKKTVVKTFWDVPEIEYLSNVYEGVEGFKKYATVGKLPSGKEATLLFKTRFAPEKNFEKFLSQNDDKIAWWWKNGENKQDYFGVKYEYPKGVSHTFYPDYLVQFNDGRIGILEVKDKGDQGGSTYTKAKSEALQKYIKDHSKKDLFGGIVVQVNDDWRINQQEHYDWEKTLRNDWRDWEELKF